MHSLLRCYRVPDAWSLNFFTVETRINEANNSAAEYLKELKFIGYERVVMPSVTTNHQFVQKSESLDNCSVAKLCSQKRLPKI